MSMEILDQTESFKMTYLMMEKELIEDTKIMHYHQRKATKEEFSTHLHKESQLIIKISKEAKF